MSSCALTPDNFRNKLASAIFYKIDIGRKIKPENNQYVIDVKNDLGLLTDITDNINNINNTVPNTVSYEYTPETGVLRITINDTEQNRESFNRGVYNYVFDESKDNREIIKTVIDKSLNIKGISIRLENEVVDYFYHSLASGLNRESSETLFYQIETLKNKFVDLISELITKKEKYYERLSKRKISDIVLILLQTEIDELKTLIKPENLETIKNIAIKKIENSVSPVYFKNFDKVFDNSQEEVSHDVDRTTKSIYNSLTEELKLFFSGIPNIDNRGKEITSVDGIPEFLSPRDVQVVVSTILSGNYNGKGTYEGVLNELKRHADSVPMLKVLTQKIEMSGEKTINALLSGSNTVRAQYYNVKAKTTNMKTSTTTIMRGTDSLATSWLKNFFKSPAVIKNESAALYSFNSQGFNDIIKDTYFKILGLHKYRGTAYARNSSFFKKTDPNHKNLASLIQNVTKDVGVDDYIYSYEVQVQLETIFKDYIDSIYKFIGINLHENTLNAILNRQTELREKQIEVKDNKLENAFDNNFRIIFKHILKLKEGGIIYEKEALNIIFTTLSNLAEIENLFGDGKKSNTINDVEISKQSVIHSKSINTASNSITNDAEYLDILQNSPYSSNSIGLAMYEWIKKTSSTDKNIFGINYVSGNVFGNYDSFSDNRLVEQTPNNYELARLLFTVDNKNYIGGSYKLANGESTTLTFYMGKVFFPTQSDKKTSALVNIPLLNILVDHISFKTPKKTKEDPVTKKIWTTPATYEIVAEVQEILYSQIIQPEINRIIDFARNGLTSESGYNAIADKFSHFPALSFVERKDPKTGKRITLSSIMNDNSVSKEQKLNRLNEFFNSEEFKTQSAKFINTYISNQVEKKKNDFGKDTLENLMKDKERLNYLKQDMDTTKYPPERLLDTLLYKYVINDLIGDVNLKMLFIGDMAFYSKIKQKEIDDIFYKYNQLCVKDELTNQDLIDKDRLIKKYIKLCKKNQYVNMVKRMAGMVAPATRTALRQDSKIGYVVFKDLETPVPNLDYVLGLYIRDKNDRTFIKEYINKEKLELTPEENSKMKSLLNKYPTLNSFMSHTVTDAQEYSTVSADLTSSFEQGLINEQQYYEMMYEVQKERKAFMKLFNDEKKRLKSESEKGTVQDFTNQAFINTLINIRESNALGNNRANLSKFGHVFQIKKPVYNNMEAIKLRDDDDNHTMVPIYVKSSAAPLVSQLTKGTSLDVMRAILEFVEQKRGYDKVDVNINGKTVKVEIPKVTMRGVPLSATKTGMFVTPINLYNEKGHVTLKSINISNVSSNSVREVSSAGWGIQTTSPVKLSDDFHTLSSFNTRLPGIIAPLLIGVGETGFKSKAAQAYFKNKGIENPTGKQLTEYLTSVHGKIVQTRLKEFRKKHYLTTNYKPKPGFEYQAARALQELYDEQSASQSHVGDNNLLDIFVDLSFHHKVKKEEAAKTTEEESSQNTEQKVDEEAVEDINNLKDQEEKPEDLGIEIEIQAQNVPFRLVQRFKTEKYQGSVSDETMRELSKYVVGENTLDRYQRDYDERQNLNVNVTNVKEAMPTWAITDKVKYRNPFLSKIKEQTVSAKMPGNILILESDAFYKLPPVSRRSDVPNIIFTNHWKPGQTALDSKTKTTENQMFIGSYFKDNNGKHIHLFKDGKVNLEYVEYDEVDKIYRLKANKFPKNILHTIGYRTPLSGQSSVSNYEIAGIIPEMGGDKAIVSSNIIVLSGHDFDFDKIYTQDFNYKFNEEGVLSEDRSNNTKFLENEYTSILFHILGMDNKMVQRSLNTPLSIESEIIKSDIFADIKEGTSNIVTSLGSEYNKEETVSNNVATKAIDKASIAVSFNNNIAVVEDKPVIKRFSNEEGENRSLTIAGLTFEGKVGEKQTLAYRNAAEYDESNPELASAIRAVNSTSLAIVNKIQNIFLDNSKYSAVSNFGLTQDNVSFYITMSPILGTKLVKIDPKIDDINGPGVITITNKEGVEEHYKIMDVALFLINQPSIQNIFTLMNNSKDIKNTKKGKKKRILSFKDVYRAKYGIYGKLADTKISTLSAFIRDNAHLLTDENLYNNIAHPYRIKSADRETLNKLLATVYLTLNEGVEPIGNLVSNFVSVNNLRNIAESQKVISIVKRYESLKSSDSKYIKNAYTFFGEVYTHDITDLNEKGKEKLMADLEKTGYYTIAIKDKNAKTETIDTDYDLVEEVKEEQEGDVTLVAVKPTSVLGNTIVHTVSEYFKATYGNEIELSPVYDKIFNTLLDRLTVFESSKEFLKNSIKGRLRTALVNFFYTNSDLDFVPADSQRKAKEYLVDGSIVLGAGLKSQSLSTYIEDILKNGDNTRLLKNSFFKVLDFPKNIYDDINPLKADLTMNAASHDNLKTSFLALLQNGNTLFPSYNGRADYTVRDLAIDIIQYTRLTGMYQSSSSLSSVIGKEFSVNSNEAEFFQHVHNNMFERYLDTNYFDSNKQELFIEQFIQNNIDLLTPFKISSNYNLSDVTVSLDRRGLPNLLSFPRKSTIKLISQVKNEKDKKNVINIQDGRKYFVLEIMVNGVNEKVLFKNVSSERGYSNDSNTLIYEKIESVKKPGRVINYDYSNPLKETFDYVNEGITVVLPTNYEVYQNVMKSDFIESKKSIRSKIETILKNTQLSKDSRVILTTLKNNGYLDKNIKIEVSNLKNIDSKIEYKEDGVVITIDESLLSSNKKSMFDFINRTPARSSNSSNAFLDSLDLDTIDVGSRGSSILDEEEKSNQNIPKIDYDNIDLETITSRHKGSLSGIDGLEIVGGTTEKTTGEDKDVNTTGDAVVSMEGTPSDAVDGTTQQEKVDAANASNDVLETEFSVIEENKYGKERERLERDEIPDQATYDTLVKVLVKSFIQDIALRELHEHLDTTKTKFVTEKKEAPVLGITITEDGRELWDVPTTVRKTMKKGEKLMEYDQELAQKAPHIASLIDSYNAFADYVMQLAAPYLNTIKDNEHYLDFLRYYRRSFNDVSFGQANLIRSLDYTNSKIDRKEALSTFQINYIAPLLSLENFISSLFTNRNMIADLTRRESTGTLSYAKNARDFTKQIFNKLGIQDKNISEEGEKSNIARDIFMGMFDILEKQKEKALKSTENQIPSSLQNMQFVAAYKVNNANNSGFMINNSNSSSVVLTTFDTTIKPLSDKAKLNCQ